MENDIESLQSQIQLLREKLERKNEKLKKTRESEQSILKKFTIIYDFAPLGFFTLDPAGGILNMNFTGAELLGEKRALLPDSQFKLFVSEESKAIFENFLKSISSENKKEWCRINLEVDEQSLVDVYIEGVITDSDRTCLLSVLNISRLRQMA